MNDGYLNPVPDLIPDLIPDLVPDPSWDFLILGHG